MTHEEHLEVTVIMSWVAQGSGGGQKEVSRGWIHNRLVLTAGVLVHTCNHSLQQWRQEDCKLEARLGYMASLRIT